MPNYLVFLRGYAEMSDTLQFVVIAREMFLSGRRAAAFEHFSPAEEQTIIQKCEGS